MVSVGQTLGLPVLAGGSRASIMVARRAIAFARITSQSAGAYCRRWSGVQGVFGVPYRGTTIWVRTVRTTNLPKQLQLQHAGVFGTVLKSAAPLPERQAKGVRTASGIFTSEERLRQGTVGTGGGVPPFRPKA